MRAIAAFARPYARAINGIPVIAEFDLSTKTFILRFAEFTGRKIDSTIPTEIFLPRVHYPNAADNPKQRLKVKASSGQFQVVKEFQSRNQHYLEGQGADPDWESIQILRYWADLGNQADALHEIRIQPA